MSIEKRRERLAFLPISAIPSHLLPFAKRQQSGPAFKIITNAD